MFLNKVTTQVKINRHLQLCYKTANGTKSTAIQISYATDSSVIFMTAHTVQSPFSIFDFPKKQMKCFTLKKTHYYKKRLSILQ
jgi:hypothetical protein